MEITGKIIKALPQREGKSQRTGNPWKTQSFVLETGEQYPRKMVFDVFGEDKLETMNIQEGETLTVSFDVDAHEYNERWYNTIRAWRVVRDGQAPATQSPAAATSTGPAINTKPASASTMNATGGDADDLPF